MATDHGPASGAEHARILGVGGYRPARVVTNDEICERIDSSDEWIRERSGIVTRRWAAPDETRHRHVPSPPPARRSPRPASAPSRSARCSSPPSPTRSDPVGRGRRRRTGSAPTDAAAFDISAACAGFCYGVALANDMVRGGSAEYVLVIGVEKLSDFTDPYDRSTAFIFGDGAGAVVIGPSDEPGIGPTSGARTARSTTPSPRRPAGSTCATTTSDFPDADDAGPDGLPLGGLADGAGRAARRSTRPASAPRTSTRSSRTRPTCASSTRMVKTLKLPAHVPVARDIARPATPRPRRSRSRWSGCSRPARPRAAASPC